MHCKVTPVTFLGTEFHENIGKISELADITAESGVLRSFEWYTALCMRGKCVEGSDPGVINIFSFSQR